MTLDRRKWLPVGMIALLMLVFQLIGPEMLRYETRLINDLEFWRLLTGHWVHANWIHYVLNMAGLILCVSLTDITWNLSQWLTRILLLTVGISMVFFAFHTNIGWYVGFSGVLFGLYILAATDTLKRQPFMSGSLLIIIGLKITLDQWSSVNMTTSELIGVPVLVEAHLYGVLIAIGITLFRILIRKLQHINTTGY